MKQKLRIYLAATLGIFLVASLGMAVWEKDRNKVEVEQNQQEQNEAQQKTQLTQDILEGEEFPTIAEQPGVGLEEIIKQAIFKKYPDWKEKNYNVSVSLEISKNNYSIGRFTYEFTYNKETQNRKVDEIWFAAKSGESWTLVATSGTGYWGKCQDFEKYNFPADMTPDCWDTEKNILIYTTNPQKFYEDGLTKADISKIIQAFVFYAKETRNSGNFVPESYLTKKLYAHINKKVGNYVRGTILVGGSQNLSAPEFFAVKQNGQWLVVHNGQDYPFCIIAEQYKFPHEILNKCHDETTKKERENIY